MAFDISGASLGSSLDLPVTTQHGAGFFASNVPPYRNAASFEFADPVSR